MSLDTRIEEDCSLWKRPNLEKNVVHQVNTNVALGLWADFDTVVKTVQHYKKRANKNNNNNSIFLIFPLNM